MLWLIDNYDSFTYNLVHLIGELGVQSHVVRNDMVTAQDVVDAAPHAVVISPGPCRPEDAGHCLEIIHALDPATPVLGVCLGHQAIAHAFGAKVVRADKQMHGKLSRISHSGAGIFDGLADPLAITRYHSLTVAPDSLPDELEATAWTDDGVLMGLRHRDRPLHGVQFHPESIATQQGHLLVSNFLKLAQIGHTPVAERIAQLPSALRAA
ncbi:MAG: aminodeoxychorismate/anthranilate synthase component II [Pseudomonadota bacterium]